MLSPRVLLAPGSVDVAHYLLTLTLASAGSTPPLELVDGIGVYIDAITEAYPEWANGEHVAGMTGRVLIHRCVTIEIVCALLCYGPSHLAAHPQLIIWLLSLLEAMIPAVCETAALMQ